jgi:hypothetical protein
MSAESRDNRQWLCKHVSTETESRGRSENRRTVGSCVFYAVRPEAIYRWLKRNENIRDLNLAVVKLTTVQMIRQPFQHKICKMDMICPAKPVLTEDLCIFQKKKIFYNILYVWNVHLTKCQAYS